MESLNKVKILKDDCIKIENNKKIINLNLSDILEANHQEKNTLNDESRDKFMKKAMINLDKITINNKNEEKLGLKSVRRFAEMERSYILSMRELVSNN